MAKTPESLLLELSNVLEQLRMLKQELNAHGFTKFDNFAAGETLLKMAEDDFEVEYDERNYMC